MQYSVSIVWLLPAPGTPYKIMLSPIVPLELLLSDILGTDPDITSRNLEDEVDKKLLKASISKLNDREKDIMEMRFGFITGKEKTQKEVADELRNITKLYI